MTKKELSLFKALILPTSLQNRKHLANNLDNMIPHLKELATKEMLITLLPYMNWSLSLPIGTPLVE